MKILAATTAAALLLALTACGGDSNENDNETADSAAKVESGQGLADMVGCTEYAGDSEEMFVTEGGSCVLDGAPASVYYFATNEARDSYLEIAAGFGGKYLVGDGWLVDADTAVLESLQDEHGGALSTD